MVDGCYSTIIQKGASEAGAIFIIHNHLDGTCSVYSQAPQAIFVEEDNLDRRFEKIHDVPLRFARSASIDSNNISNNPNIILAATLPRIN